jgi:hypothetical protein
MRAVHSSHQAAQMKLTIILPSYLPALALLAREQSADVVIVADSFLMKKGAANRTAIKAIQGMNWLTVPVLGKPGQALQEVMIDNHQNWRHKHYRAITSNYSGAAYFSQYAGQIAALYSGEWHDLLSLALAGRNLLYEQGFEKKKLVFSSTLPHRKDRTERLLLWLDLCQCDHYLLPGPEMLLINPETIVNANKRLAVFSMEPFVYHQQHGSFIANLSILDLLFNEGPLSWSLLRKHSSLQEIGKGDAI